MGADIGWQWRVLLPLLSLLVGEQAEVLVLHQHQVANQAIAPMPSAPRPIRC
jgi:hypothetical protein